MYNDWAEKIGVIPWSKIQEIRKRKIINNYSPSELGIVFF